MSADARDPADPLDPRRVADAADLLEAVVADRALLADLDPALRRRLLEAAGRASRPSKREKVRLAKAHRRRDRQARIAEDEALLQRTGIRRLRDEPIFRTPRMQAADAVPSGGSAGSARAGEPRASTPIGAVHEARSCYVCHRDYTEIHPFYDQLCLACGDFNFAKRSPTGDLTGRVALVTGARVKICYQAAILLLRAGCRVVVTTRFPKDAALRYAREPDFADWADRLEIEGIDLRHVPSVEQLCERLLARLPRLDCLINNACQTVRRPPGFYDHLMAVELGDDRLPDDARMLLAPGVGRPTEAGMPAAALSAIPLLPGDTARELFPAGRLDADLQQVDLRQVNSWRLKLAEVPTVELLEVHLVNAVAPFVLNARLKPLMATGARDAHVVNVSAMEGQFYRTTKGDRHPHTNMAKAALNMMTRTSARDYVDDGIHMNSVDTGWVTDEDPVIHAERKRLEHRFHPPLDIVDGAARIVDPFFDGLATGDHVWGQFLKDYRPTDW